MTLNSRGVSNAIMARRVSDDPVRNREAHHVTQNIDSTGCFVTHPGGHPNSSHCGKDRSRI